MKVKRVDVDSIEKEVDRERRSIRKKDYESINGVLLRKDRLDTVLTVDTLGNVIAVSGKNPKNKKIGDNIYE